MKKIISILSVALALVACNKSGLQTEYESIPAPDELYGAIAGQNDDGTKAYFVGPVIDKTNETVSYPHFWEIGDDISVFWENNQNMLYRCYNNISNTRGGNGAYSKFGRYISMPLSGAEVKFDARYCVYPFDLRNTVDANGTISFYVPVQQKYRTVTHDVDNKDYVSYGDGFFQDNNGHDYTTGCAVFVAKNTESKDKNYNYFNFFNVGCWLKLQITSESEFTLGKIVLKGNNNQILAGCASTKFTKTSKDDAIHHILEESSVITTAAGGSKTVTLLGDGSKTINSTASDVYIYLLPTTFFQNIAAAANQGFTLEIYDNSSTPKLMGTAVAKSTSTGSVGENEVFKRNRVVLMSEWNVTDLKFAVLTVKGWENEEKTIIFE